ncbi:MAG: Electron transfer flavoprotein beta subunit [Rhodoglobus sp.]|nr:Electron transfer flavoprotein beta subunit [Rhodoglobus sp.]
MKIVVLVKEVPDTYADRKLSLETGLAKRDGGENVLDEIGERALEVALSYADKHPDTEVVVMSMSPATAIATLTKGLAMGAASAVHIVDETLLGADLGLTAEVLASALRKKGFDLVVAGNLSTDGSGGVLPAMLAELLEVPAATALSTVEIDEHRVSGTRASDSATMTISALLPAVISITEALPDARFPSFKGIMAAKRKPIEMLSLAGLGVDAERPDGARSIIIDITEKSARKAGVKITDQGDAGEKLAVFLLENRLA